MAGADVEHTFQGTPEKCFAGIRQYQKYPEYLPGVIKITVLPPQAEGSSCQVRYELNIIKTFFYVLDMFEEAPHRISWTLAESNLMKENKGEWQLKAKGPDKTQARYKLDVAFKGLVPSAVVNGVTKANMPAMFAGFQKMIDESV